MSGPLRTFQEGFFGILIHKPKYGSEPYEENDRNQSNQLGYFCRRNTKHGYKYTDNQKCHQHRGLAQDATTGSDHTDNISYDCDRLVVSGHRGFPETELVYTLVSRIHLNHQVPDTPTRIYDLDSVFAYQKDLSISHPCAFFSGARMGSNEATASEQRASSPTAGGYSSVFRAG